MNGLKIKGAIKAYGLTQSEFAQELNISAKSLCDKLNGKRPFRLNEAQYICDRLNISSDIFFEK